MSACQHAAVTATAGALAGRPLRTLWSPACGGAA